MKITRKYLAEFEIQTRFIYVYSETIAEALALLASNYKNPNFKFTYIEEAPNSLADFRV